MSATARPPRRGLLARLAAIDDGDLMRVAFYALLAGTLGVVYIDWRELSDNDAAAAALSPSALPAFPLLPGFETDSPMGAPRPVVTTDRALLEAPLAISLGAGGVLTLTGTIDPGAAARFAAEVAARGEYITTIALDSPGGSVTDAIAIGRAIRAGGFATSVAAGALCASSCPLALAGGVTRSADPAAAIGIHQVYATLPPDRLPSGWKAAAVGMSEGQRTTAMVSRYLTEMGVEPAIWLHALETPPERLYYLSADEMTSAALLTPPPRT